MAQSSTPLGSLIVDPGTPPQEWLDLSTSSTATSIILSLWETTVFLIENQEFLGRNQERFLAMVHDHKVTFRTSCKYESTSYSQRQQLQPSLYKGYVIKLDNNCKGAVNSVHLYL